MKTRLVPPLTATEAAALSECLLRDTSACMLAAVRHEEADLIAAFSPVESREEFQVLLPGVFHLLPQRGESLGERLFNAAQEALTQGYESVCLIGSDSPGLPPEFLVTAITTLKPPGDRIVLGPADDGGYYLMGLKSAHRRVFEDIEWSTGQVLAQTIDRATELGVEVRLLQRWYDLDDECDLKRACRELLSPGGVAVDFTERAAGHTRDYLAGLIKDRTGWLTTSFEPDEK